VPDYAYSSDSITGACQDHLKKVFEQAPKDKHFARAVHPVEVVLALRHLCQFESPEFSFGVLRK